MLQRLLTKPGLYSSFVHDGPGAEDADADGSWSQQFVLSLCVRVCTVLRKLCLKLRFVTYLHSLATHRRRLGGHWDGIFGSMWFTCVKTTMCMCCKFVQVVPKATEVEIATVKVSLPCQRRLKPFTSYCAEALRAPLSLTLTAILFANACGYSFAGPPQRLPVNP